MPILLEGEARSRKPRRWVWLLAVGLVAAVGACTAYLPMVCPYAFLGEWREEGRVGSVLYSREDRRVWRQDKYYLWRLAPRNRVDLYVTFRAGARDREIPIATER